MKFAIVFAAVLAVSAAQFGPSRPVANRVAGNDQTAQVLRYDNDINPDGSYKYDLQIDNGISAQVQGTPRDFGGNPPLVPIVAQGSFSWTSPEGVPVALTFTADENGYNAVGDAIPTPHPIPEAILRAIAYNEKNQKK